mgnify:CR=1 FL=1
MLSLSSCSSSDGNDAQDKAPDPQSPSVGQLLQITSGIGNWDAAYLTDEGYYCYAADLARVALSSRAEGDENSSDNLSVISYTSKDGNLHATLTVDKTSNLPVQIYTDNEILNFVFLNDTVLEVVYDNNVDRMDLLDSVAYNKAELLASSTYDNPLQRPLFYLTTLVSNARINVATLEELFGTYKSALAYTISDVADEAAAAAIEEMSLPVDESGNFTFATEAETWSSETIVKVYYTISVWTGNAKFKVGGSSCTLDGSIICPTNDYNSYGRYGIVVSPYLDSLTIENAQYVEYGTQEEGSTSYEIDFRGFKPNTTYYYAAFYQFNEGEHGDFQFKYGDPDANIYYADYASFVTGDNHLSVDVVMCIDFTGSMGGIIGTVKENAIAFYEQFKERCDLAGITLTGMKSQVIGFQDKNVDGDLWFKMSPNYSMPAEQSDFNAYVNDEIYAMGGGDIPESGLEALDAAFSKSDWGYDDGYHRQVVILWTDAPYLVRMSADSIPQYYTDYVTDSLGYYVTDSLGNYITVEHYYTDLTTDMVKAKWDAMPSGKRLILFAPKGESWYDNGGSWDVMDSWKNVIHEEYTSSSFGDFSYILDAIVGELASVKKAPAKSSAGSSRKIKLTPKSNK